MRGPSWRHVSHFETSNKRLHYIERADDIEHDGIERHTVSKPSDPATYKQWFEYEGIPFDTLQEALKEKRP